LPTIDTRRQGSIDTVFFFAKKPCFIVFLTGLFRFYGLFLLFYRIFLLLVVRLSCTTLLQDLNLMPFLTFGFPTFCSVGVNLDYSANSSFNQDLNSSL